MCFLLGAGLCLSTMNPASAFAFGGASRPEAVIVLATEQIYAAHPPRVKTQHMVTAILSQLQRPDPAPTSDVYFGPERLPLKDWKNKITLILSRKGGEPCQVLTTHLAKQRKWY